MCSGELLQSAVDRREAYRLTLDALDFPGRPPVGDMGTKTDAGINQGGQAAAGFTILQLGEAIRDVAYRAAELPRRALVAVSAIAMNYRFLRLAETILEKTLRSYIGYYSNPAASKIALGYPSGPELNSDGKPIDLQKCGLVALS